MREREKEEAAPVSERETNRHGSRSRQTSKSGTNEDESGSVEKRFPDHDDIIISFVFRGVFLQIRTVLNCCSFDLFVYVKYYLDEISEEYL